ncbi:hypothetical protein ACA910_017200 [Epithemia clementina (nom. ined.)]
MVILALHQLADYHHNHCHNNHNNNNKPITVLRAHGRHCHNVVNNTTNRNIAIVLTTQSIVILLVLVLRFQASIGYYNKKEQEQCKALAKAELEHQQNIKNKDDNGKDNNKRANHSASNEPGAALGKQNFIDSNNGPEQQNLSLELSAWLTHKQVKPAFYSQK